MTKRLLAKEGGGLSAEPPSKKRHVPRDEKRPNKNELAKIVAASEIHGKGVSKQPVASSEPKTGRKRQPTEPVLGEEREATTRDIVTKPKDSKKSKEKKRPSAAVAGEGEKGGMDEQDLETFGVPERADPYLVREKVLEVDAEIRWTNKQRTLLFASRGINTVHRHLLEDLKSLMPHHKTENKWDKSQSLEDIVEVAEIANCNNVWFFEAKKHKDLYLWIAKTPNGPSVKFQVHNVHTMGGTNYLGNHLKYSRPLLVFDRAFDIHPSLPLLREMLVQSFGTPRCHPKSKPFHDHVLSFCWNDNKIWVRHYQIFSEKFSSKVNDQELIEVGPRFTLDPIRIFDSPFGGKTLWKNNSYVSPVAIRAQIKQRLGLQYRANAERAMATAEKQSKKSEAMPTSLTEIKKPFLAVLE